MSILTKIIAFLVIFQLFGSYTTGQRWESVQVFAHGHKEKIEPSLHPIKEVCFLWRHAYVGKPYKKWECNLNCETSAHKKKCEASYVKNNKGRLIKSSPRKKPK